MAFVGARSAEAKIGELNVFLIAARTFAMLNSRATAVSNSHALTYA
jgi:hypothetical protein